MATTTLTYSGSLIATSCWCGIALAIPSRLYKEAQRNHRQDIYCPLGHTFVFAGETEEQKLRRQLGYAQDRAARESARADQIEASRRAYKGQVTRLRKQVLEGDCPFCGQHLRDLQRHVQRKHSDEVAEVPEQALA